MKTILQDNGCRYVDVYRHGFHPKVSDMRNWSLYVLLSVSTLFVLLKQDLEYYKDFVSVYTYALYVSV